MPSHEFYLVLYNSSFTMHIYSKKINYGLNNIKIVDRETVENYVKKCIIIAKPNIRIINNRSRNGDDSLWFLVFGFVYIQVGLG